MPESNIRHRFRNRAGAIVVAAGHILLMRRVRKEFGTYYVFPGGGVETGEDVRAALRRELVEETGLRATVRQKVFFGQTPSGATHTYSLVEAPYVPVAMPKGAEERDPGRVRERGTTDPVWVTLAQFRKLNVLPPKAHQAVGLALKHGFPKTPVDLGVLWHRGRRHQSLARGTRKERS